VKAKALKKIYYELGSKDSSGFGSSGFGSTGLGSSNLVI